VHFCGRRRDPAPWIAGASALLVPSRVRGGSQAAILGMGLGVPVIGTAVDGLAPMLSEDRGVVVTPDDPRALARAISGVLSGELAPDLAAARRFARQFGLDEVAGVYETAYRELATPGVLGFAAPHPYYSRTPDDRPLRRAASSAQRPGPVRRP
jgi:glycosyltransferase involved in cell wall biosynthesis